MKSTFSPITTALFISATMFGCSTAWANVAVNILGVLQEPPSCTIDDGKGAPSLEVNFDDIRIDEIDGTTNKKMELIYHLQCSNLTNNTVQLQFLGTRATGFGTNVLAVPGREGFGIALFRGETPQALNTNFGFNYTTTHPQLFLVPAKLATSTLAAGEFNTNATLQITYQ